MAGPVRIQVENHAEVRTLPSVCLANDALHSRGTVAGLHGELAIPTQTFRGLADDTEIIVGDQRLKITSSTFLFTDLRGSTALYERVVTLRPDEYRFPIRRDRGNRGGCCRENHRRCGDGHIPDARQGCGRSDDGREAMRELNHERGNEDLLLKIGIDVMPCIAVMNE